MALPAAFLDELRARTPIAALIGRRTRLTRSGRNWKGCCPFHGEKTPSFYVYDDHFHCFGCGAHGDVIGFTMQSAGVGFMEAIEQLAGEAGLSVPKPTPEAAEAERKRLDLHAVLDAATTAFARRLRLPEGRAALDYLLGRGLSDPTITGFALGWSGEGRGAITSDLTREGVTQDQLVEAGLLRRDEESGRVYDLFFNRVMFPIRDARGRVVSFGGRIMGDGQPKYVNGPETILFSKRRNLYGLDRARQAARAGATLVVVEGYMDVIALAQAGFGAAVAPLGTALTEEQLDALWRVSPRPVLCFDGDKAGARAAARAAELALPMITAERGLDFVTLPAGEDPDSLVRQRGAGAFQALLDAARPMVERLFDLLRAPGGEATPELRAALLKRLDEAAGRIQDRALAAEYRRALRDRFYAATRPAARGRFAPAETTRPPRPRPETGMAEAERLRVLTAILLRHPVIWADVGHAFAGLALDARLEGLRDALGAWMENAETLDSAALISHLDSLGLLDAVAGVLAASPVPLPGCAQAGAMPAEAEAGWWHIFGLLNVTRLRHEVRQSQDRLACDMTRDNLARHQALTEALLKVESGESDGLDMTA